MSNTLKIIIEKFGSPEVMSLVPDTISAPGAEEVTVRHTAIGFNSSIFINVAGCIRLSYPPDWDSEQQVK